jgi:hypothetical protein
MRIPSIKTLATHLRLSHDNATRLRKLLDGRLDPMTFARVEAWVRQCYNRPRQCELIMCAADELLETHGVEVITGEYVDNYHGAIRYEYCNAGDTYAATLVRDTRNGRYLVTSVGDLIERDETLGSC